MSHNYLHQTSAALEVWSHRDKMPEYQCTTHQNKDMYNDHVKKWQSECTKTAVAESEREAFKDLGDDQSDLVYLGEDVVSIKRINTGIVSMCPTGLNRHYKAYVYLNDAVKPVPEAVDTKDYLRKESIRLLDQFLSETSPEELEKLIDKYKPGTVSPAKVLINGKHVGDWDSSEAMPDSTELWREVIDIVDTVSRRSEGYASVIKELKKQFKNIERI